MVSRLLACAGVVTVAIVGTTTPAALAGDDSGSSGVMFGTCSGTHPTIVGTSGDDVITGTSKADVILAKGGDDVVHGGGGQDVICLGRGNDEAFGDGGLDIIDAGPGPDYVDGGETTDLVFGAGGTDTLVDDGTGDVLQGGSGGDVITVDPTRGSYVDAGGGDDRVVVHAAAGLDGSISLDGGPGHDDQIELSVAGPTTTARLNQRTSSLVVFGYQSEFAGWELSFLTGEMDWKYFGHAADESLLVYGGSLTAFMGDGDDNVNSFGSGDAYIDLGPGDLQSAESAGGDDVLVGGPGPDRLVAGPGDDVLEGGAGPSDQLYGGEGTDVGKDPDGTVICDVEVQLGSCAVPTN